MRVGYVIPSLREGSGWGTACTGAIRSMSRFVDPVLFVSPADLSIAREEFVGFQILQLPEIQPIVGGPLRVLRAITPTLIRIRRQPRVALDLVHSLEMFPAGWVGDSLAAHEGAPHVLTAFGTYAVIWRTWPLLAALYGRVLRRAAYVCPMSRGTDQRMRAAFGPALARTPSEVVLQGTEFASRVPRKVAKERRWPQAPALLSVGAVKPRKGYHVSLQAFGLLQQHFPEARYRIAGGGLGNEYHRALGELIERDHIRNVEFLGARTWIQLDPCFRESSLFVMTSQEEPGRFEGFVLAFLEAGAFGLPVIGTRTGGIPDAVREGETGFLYQADDVAGIAGGMQRLASDSRLASTMGLAGRAWAEQLTWDRYAQQQFAIYERVLGRGPVGG